MNVEQAIQSHYKHEGLIDTILTALKAQGIDPQNVRSEDLAPIDEFHVGGRAASEHFLNALDISAAHQVLDVGCGLGGPARFVAATYGAKITGIDLTPDYIAAGQTLCEWVGLSDQLQLICASALNMPIPELSFDRAYMMHVGMNIEDKDALFGEIYRVLKPGGRFGVYDIMLTGSDALDYPLPWSSTPATSWLADSDTYRSGLEQAGFRVVTEINRAAFALDFFQKVQVANARRGGPPPLGLHTLMGASTPEKLKNLVASLSQGRVAPVVMIAEKR